MARQRPTPRDERRRGLGQNFLWDHRVARALAATCPPDHLVLDLGAGTGALTVPLARAGARVVAVEADAAWADRLRARLASLGLGDRVSVVVGDLSTVALPAEPYRVVANPPFNLTTALLHRLLDDPRTGPERLDVVVQWAVARKRAMQPPTTLVSTAWAPWWEVELQRRIPRQAFRPVPAVDAGWLTVTKRSPPLLPAELATDFAGYLRGRWSTVMST